MSKQDFSLLGMPVHDTPLFKEQQGSDWITYGADDCYAGYLEYLYLGSSIHSAIVNGVGAMVYGEGLDAHDRDENDGSREQWLRLQTLLGDSDTDLLRKIALDVKLYGQAYVNTIWNRSRTQIAKMKHIPVHTLRAGVADSDGNIDLWYYKTDWHDQKSRSKPLAIRSFSDTDRTEASRILQIKRYAPSFHYYGLPDYVGSTGYVELDHEIQAFHLNNIKNGLFPSMLMSFNNGVPTDEERRMIEQKVMEKFQGSQGAGKVLITFNDGADTAPTFTPVTSNASDTMYEYLSSEVTRKVLSGHRVTSPLLFGVRGDGTGFGNNADELRDSYSLFTNTVVGPMQDLILRSLAPVFATNGISLDLFFRPLKPADFLDLTQKGGQDEPATSFEGSHTTCCEKVPQNVLFEADLGEEELESYSDYPKSVSNNAKRGIELNENQGNKCATQTGKVRAQQLAKGEAISVTTIKRMYSYLSRAETYYDPNKTTECGTISYLLWGGKSALGWSRNKLRELGLLEATIDDIQANVEFSDEQADEAFEWLFDRGEEIDLDEYELIDSRQVDYADEDRQDALFAFARVPKNNPSAKSKQDNPLIKVRYAYAPNKTSSNSRDFCKKMTSALKVYRKEDIEAAGKQPVNKGFGEGGSSTYSIWLYKGGARCHHFWERQTFLQKNNKLISVNEARKLIQSLPPNERPQYRIPVNPKEVAKRPVDMPNKGFSPNNPNLPRDARK